MSSQIYQENQDSTRNLPGILATPISPPGAPGFLQDSGRTTWGSEKFCKFLWYFQGISDVFGKVSK
jgi:hypothetical protein